MPRPEPRRPRPLRRARKPRASPRPRARWQSVLFLLLPTGIVLLAVFISTRWYGPTAVEVEAVVRRLAFVVGGTEEREILDRSARFSALVFEDLAEVVLTPERLEVADPLAFLPGEPGEAGRFPESAWREIEVSPPVRFLGSDPDAKVALLPPNGREAELGSLDRMPIAPGTRVELEVPPGQDLDKAPEKDFAVTLRIDAEQTLAISIENAEDLLLVTDLVELEGIPPPFPSDILRYRARLAESLVRLRSDDRLTLVVTPAGSSKQTLLSGALIPLAAVELHGQGLGGRPETALLADGTLRYPGFAKVEPVALMSDEWVGLGELGDFQLRSLEPEPAKGGLKVRLEGEVGRARTVRGVISAERRLSLYQRMRYGPFWQLLAGVAVWAISTTWVAYERWKKIEG